MGIIRMIHEDEIKHTVARLFREACCSLPEDVLEALRSAKAQECGHANAILGQILENEAMARQANRPCCQDTGMAVVFMDVGCEVHVNGNIQNAVNAGVAQAYTEGYFRKSTLQALSREPITDNTPAVLHTRYVPGDTLTVWVAPKGFGSENMSRVYMLKPAQGREGILNAIVETARQGAANACPPVILGVGIGGTMEQAALASKRVLLRELNVSAPNAEVAALEQEALQRINELGIGPMGLGGKTTALAVHIEEMPTHIAGLPVAINVQCHCARHAMAVL
ncbi:MAG: fumarate hydratase [Eubacteriales bacterium]|nr:fumarate hydratase [Eubacteriales bacterium]